MELNNITYGVLWIPSSSVVNIIQSLKDQVRSVESDAIYLNHPVHSTFFLFIDDSKDELQIITELEKCAETTVSFPIEFEKWHIFESDSVTGGDTITLSIKPSESLFRLQEIIAESLTIFKKVPVHYLNSWAGVYKISYDKWGFPFVGKHWFPHLSIASVKGKGKALINGIMNHEKIPENDLLSSISLYRIQGEIHKHLKTIYLKSTT